MELPSTQAGGGRELRIQAIVEEVARRRAGGEEIPDSQVLDEHPDLLPELAAKLRALGRITDALEESEESEKQPYAQGDMIAHFRVERVLGQGHFGTVYLARDENLDRPVAIKIPRPERLAEEHRVEEYLEEARRIAQLDPAKGIVPVYHADRLNGSCFVVYAFFDGGDLCELMQDRKLSPTEAAELIAQIAETLQYVHEQRIYHRDIKPANIFIDANIGRPFLGDFGLALTDEDFGKGPREVGTVFYIEPRTGSWRKSPREQQVGPF